MTTPVMVEAISVVFCTASSAFGVPRNECLAGLGVKLPHGFTKPSIFVVAIDCILVR